MEAIILTEDQATQLVAARGPNDIRILEPRRLQDGRLMLNADILDDPFFADPAKPWAQIIAGQSVTVDQSADAVIADAGATIDAQVAAALTDVRSQIVELTDADLAEPQ